MLEFKIQGQKITRLDNKEIATDSQNYLKAHFTFCDDWTDCVKVAIFRSSEKRAKVYLDDHNECFVPWEVLSKCECGINCFKDTLTLYASVYAIDEQTNKRITTNETKFEINKSGYSEEASSSELPPDIYLYKTTEVNENSTDEEYATAKAVFTYGETKTDKTDFESFKKEVENTYTKKTNFNDLQTEVTDLKAETEVTKKATGNAITIDSAKAPLANLKLYGKTTQNGTPTPETPITLVSAGDSGNLNFWAYAKNLLYVTVTTQTKNGVTYTVNNDGSITVSGTATALSIIDLCSNIAGKLALGKTYKMSDIWACRIRKTDNTYVYPADRFIYTSDMLEIYPYLQIKSGTTVNKTYYPMLLLDEETDLTFEPCNRQLAQFPYTLRSVGDVKDELNFDGEIYDYFGKGIHIQKLHSIVFNGSESENWEALTDGRVAITVDSQYTPNTASTEDLYKPAKAICNIASVVSWVDLKSVTNGFAIGSASSRKIGFKVAGHTESVEAWKTYLAANPVTIVYVLRIPIETPITETDFNVFRQIRTNKGNTTIFCEAEAKIEYYANNANAQAIGNIHELVHFSYFKLNRAILALGGNT